MKVEQIEQSTGVVAYTDWLQSTWNTVCVLNKIQKLTQNYSMSHITKELFDLAMISPGTDFNKKFLYIGVLYGQWNWFWIQILDDKNYSA